MSRPTATIHCVCGSKCAYNDRDRKSVDAAASWAASHVDRREWPLRMVRHACEPSVTLSWHQPQLF